ncbi:MAG: hypothetical protein GYA23_12075 [Methanomicrobiales archaeon]|nr:hypothetical protein [Methanomicrobiales archaeon]
MQKKPAHGTLAGATAEEKLGSLGLVPGRTVDVRTLGRIANTHNVEITLFFEDDLARNRTFESVKEEFGNFSEYERPYINVTSFLQFTRENGPSFEATMEAFPLMIEIVKTGEKLAEKDHKPVLFATGLMPFLDEFDVNAPPPEPNI